MTNLWLAGRMQRPQTATCARCGAQLEPPPGSDRATCSYCGTVSFLPRGPVATPPPARTSNPTPWLLVGLSLGALTFIGVAVCVFLLIGGAPAPSVTAPPPITPAAT